MYVYVVRILKDYRVDYIYLYSIRLEIARSEDRVICRDVCRAWAFIGLIWSRLSAWK